MDADLSMTATLLSDPGRAAILLSLMSGIALPAGELARIANVTPQTASAHLGKLVDGRLLIVERQGRHRYYRLSGTEVADAIEALMVLTPEPPTQPTVCKQKSRFGTLGHARTCYAHLAGWLGVQIAEALEQRAFLVPVDTKSYAVTAAGQLWFKELGIEAPLPEVQRPTFARRCLDWSERRHHLSGPLGRAMYRRLKELKWICPVRDTRIVRVSVEGESRFWELLRISAS